MQQSEEFRVVWELAPVLKERTGVTWGRDVCPVPAWLVHQRLNRVIHACNKPWVDGAAYHQHTIFGELLLICFAEHCLATLAVGGEAKAWPSMCGRLRVRVQKLGLHLQGILRFRQIGPKGLEHVHQSGPDLQFYG